MPLSGSHNVGDSGHTADHNLIDAAIGAVQSSVTAEATARAAADAALQPLDADLTVIAALDSATAGVLATDGTGWVRKTYAQLKTALGLVKADVGLGNVDNTADASKPVSTAQAAADAAVQATAVQRVNHTGTQLAATVSDFSTAALAATSGAYESIATPPLRRRVLPNPADAIAVNGEVPTVTFSTSNTTIASNQFAPPLRVGGVAGAAWDLTNDTHYLVGGTPNVPADGASPVTRVRAPQIGVSNPQVARYPVSISFFYDGTTFEFLGAFPGTTFDYRLVVDGKVSIANGTLTPGAGGGSVKFVFGSAKVRHITLTVTDMNFQQINYQPLYRLWRPPQPSMRRLFAIGDSITFGTNVQPTQSWMWDLGRTLGCDETWNAGIGGTSWTATDGTQYGGNRLTELAPFIRPNDVVCFFGSRNDSSGTQAQRDAVQAAVTAVLGNADVAACKNVYVATNITVINTLAASIVAGAVAAGKVGIDASSWITGTGTTAAPNGTGNSDLYIGADGVHPANAAAYSYLARRWDAEVKAAMPS